MFSYSPTSFPNSGPINHPPDSAPALLSTAPCSLPGHTQPKLSAHPHKPCQAFPQNCSQHPQPWGVPEDSAQDPGTPPSSGESWHGTERPSGEVSEEKLSLIYLSSMAEWTRSQYQHNAHEESQSPTNYPQTTTRPVRPLVKLLRLPFVRDLLLFRFKIKTMLTPLLKPRPQPSAAPPAAWQRGLQPPRPKMAARKSPAGLCSDGAKMAARPRTTPPRGLCAIVPPRPAHDGADPSAALLSRGPRTPGTSCTFIAP